VARRKTSVEPPEPEVQGFPGGEELLISIHERERAKAEARVEPLEAENKALRKELEHVKKSKDLNLIDLTAMYQWVKEQAEDDFAVLARIRETGKKGELIAEFEGAVAAYTRVLNHIADEIGYDYWQPSSQHEDDEDWDHY
jgi:hypothetical protein